MSGPNSVGVKAPLVDSTVSTYTGFCLSVQIEVRNKIMKTL
uniref:Uncharacterized protein n=1 Tax=Anguilla anguilla TaxID=7936 RepID=A0A0E9S0W3_ANGAN